MSLIPPFDRDVFCVAGLPFDAVDLSAASVILEDSANNKKRVFLSTPNLNWLRTSRNDRSFGETTIRSDLSIADGMPVILLSRILKLPITQRVAGSDLIDHLVAHSDLQFFFFGGNEGTAEKATQNLRKKTQDSRVVGYYYPGFGSIDDMSTSEIITYINDTSPDFVVVSLGALKGQFWIIKNLEELRSPIISHLGAVVNFYADSVKRAPLMMQKFGLEWLWRIYQEPSLGKRYWLDGLFLLKELVLRVLPYRFLILSSANTPDQQRNNIQINISKLEAELIFSGYFDLHDRFYVKRALAETSKSLNKVKINLDGVTYVDSSFIGALLLMKKYCIDNQTEFSVHSNSRRVKKIFYYCGAEYLLD